MTLAISIQEHGARRTSSRPRVLMFFVCALVGGWLFNAVPESQVSFTLDPQLTDDLGFAAGLVLSVVLAAIGAGLVLLVSSLARGRASRFLVGQHWSVAAALLYVPVTYLSSHGPLRAMALLWALGAPVLAGLQAPLTVYHLSVRK